jgi:hypothetical protein
MADNDQIASIRMCKSNGISRLRSTFSSKGGGGGEDRKMAKSPTNWQFHMTKSGGKGSLYGPNRSDSGEFERNLIEFERQGGQKRS